MTSVWAESEAHKRGGAVILSAFIPLLSQAENDAPQKEKGLLKEMAL